MVALKRNTSSNEELTNLYKSDKDFRTLIKLIKEMKKDFTWEEVEVLLDSNIKLSSALEGYVLSKINEVYFLGGQKSKLMLKIKHNEIRSYIKSL